MVAGASGNAQGQRPMAWGADGWGTSRQGGGWAPGLPRKGAQHVERNRDGGLGGGKSLPARAMWGRESGGGALMSWKKSGVCAGVGRGGAVRVKGWRSLHLPRSNASPDVVLDDDGSPLKKSRGLAAAPPRGIEPRPLAAKPPGVPSKRQEAHTCHPREEKRARRCELESQVKRLRDLRGCARARWMGE